MIKDSKKCSKCGEVKTKECFAIRKIGDKSYLRSSCKKCVSLYRKGYDKNYYIKNREKILQKSKKYLSSNKEKIKIYNKSYRDKNKDNIKDKKIIYQEKNKDKILKAKKKYYRKNKDSLSKKKKEHYYENKDLYRVRNKIYRTENKDKIDLYSKEYQLKNKDKIREQRKKFRENNKEKTAYKRSLPYVKEKRNENRRKRYKEDFQYKITLLLRCRLSKLLKTQNTKKRNKTLDLIGCSINEFCKHIENQFDENMSWDNHGSYWHLDHIYPLSKADLTKESEIKRVMHYSNFQPLEAIENIKKGNKIL